MEPGPHVEEMEAAIRADGEGLRALLDGDEERGRERLVDAVTRYRASWELAPPRSYGRLIGMLKAAVIAGDAADAAAYARAAVPDADSPPSSYVRAVAGDHRRLEHPDQPPEAARRRELPRGAVVRDGLEQARAPGVGVAVQQRPQTLAVGVDRGLHLLDVRPRLHGVLTSCHGGRLGALTMRVSARSCSGGWGRRSW